MVRNQQVIVVQMNYRLQGTGFAMFEDALLEQHGYVDNLGLRDQFLALA